MSDTRLDDDRFEIINACDIPGYEFLGKDWAESEVIYNAYKLNLFSDIDFVGLIHYDFNLYCPEYDTYRITENIENILQKYEWISFFAQNESLIRGIYDVLMDDRKPNCLFVKHSGLDSPKSCLDYLENIITSETGLTEHISSNVSLCCSFLSSRDKFLDVGRMISAIKDSNILNKFDTEKRHRYPGQVMERLVALYSQRFNHFKFNLDHRFVGGNKLNEIDPNGENY